MIVETTAKLASNDLPLIVAYVGLGPGLASIIRRSLVALLDRAPLPLFAIALMLAVFAGGIYVGMKKVYPYDLLRAAYKTGKTLVRAHIDKVSPSPIPLLRTATFVDLISDSVEARRFEFIGADTLADPILVMGGAEHFAEYCPGAKGCLAVEYAGRGEVRHAYPYRPEEFENASIIVSFPYEQIPGFSFFHYAYPVGISRYSNGDLLIVFHFRDSFPFTGGVARVDRDGQVIWYRRDYSHHRPYMTDGNIALVPSLRIGEGPIEIELKNKERTVRTLDCQDGKFYRDFVHILDGKGRLLKEISILDAILESPYAFAVYNINITDSCDPTHLNFVHQLREDAGGVADIEPGDLVVSLRNLNAFGILDRKSHRLKKLVRGEFFWQHSVTHLEGAKFLMLDNLGGDGIHGPSRLLLVDLANGEETTIFPNDRTPGHLRDMFIGQGGHISISPDRRRCIISFYSEGKAVEVRLADGAVLSAFTNLHDLAHLNGLSDKRKTKAGRYWLRFMTYIKKKE